MKAISGSAHVVRLRGGVPSPFGERTGRCQPRWGRHGCVSWRGPGTPSTRGLPVLQPLGSGQRWPRLTGGSGSSQGGSGSSRASGEGGFWGVSSLCWGNILFLSSFLFSQPRARALAFPPALVSSTACRDFLIRQLRRDARPRGSRKQPHGTRPRPGGLGWAATGALRGWETGPANPEHAGIAFRCHGPHTSLLLPVPLGVAHAAKMALGGCHSTRDGQRADPASWPGAECTPGGCSLLGDAAPSRCLTGVFWLSRLRVCSGQGQAPAAQRRARESPWSDATRRPHVPVPRPPPVLLLRTPLLWGGLGGGSRIFPSFGFSSCSPRSHSLVTACRNSCRSPAGSRARSLAPPRPAVGLQPPSSAGDGSVAGGRAGWLRGWAGGRAAAGRGRRSVGGKQRKGKKEGGVTRT